VGGGVRRQGGRGGSWRALRVSAENTVNAEAALLKRRQPSLAFDWSNIKASTHHAQPREDG